MINVLLETLIFWLSFDASDSHVRNVVLELWPFEVRRLAQTP